MKPPSTTPAVPKTSRYSENDGFVLPTVLVVLAVVFAVGAILLSQVAFAIKANSQYRDYEHCLLTGNSAVAICQANLSSDLQYSGTSGETEAGDGSSYTIAVQHASDTLRQITITSRCKTMTKTFSGQATVDPGNNSVISFNVLLVK